MGQWLQRIAAVSAAALGTWALLSFIALTVLGIDPDAGTRFVTRYRVDIILTVVFATIALWGYLSTYRSMVKFSDKVHGRLSSVEMVILEGQIANFYRWHIMQDHEFTDMDARELYELEQRRQTFGLNGYNQRRMQIMLEVLERQNERP